jgi:hypothetical protein
MCRAAAEKADCLVAVDRAACSVEPYVSGTTHCLWWWTSRDVHAPRWCCVPHNEGLLAQVQRQLVPATLDPALCYVVRVEGAEGMVTAPPNAGRAVVVVSTWRESSCECLGMGERGRRRGRGHHACAVVVNTWSREGIELRMYGNG